MYGFSNLYYICEFLFRFPLMFVLGDLIVGWFVHSIFLVMFISFYTFFFRHLFIFIPFSVTSDLFLILFFMSFHFFTSCRSFSLQYVIHSVNYVRSFYLSTIFLISHFVLHISFFHHYIPFFIFPHFSFFLFFVLLQMLFPNFIPLNFCLTLQ